MSHLPVNHRLIPFYRTLDAACGIYLLVFGAAGLVQTRGLEPFDRDEVPSALGLHTNAGFAVTALAFGAVILVTAIIGGDFFRWVSLVGGVAFLVMGLAALALLETRLNVLAFSITNCIVWFVIGLILFAAGLYGRTGARSEVLAEEGFRHGRRADTEAHPWNEG
jgi:hypothetical protein